MNKVTRSAAGAHLQTHLYLGKPYVPMANSTINQDLRIQEALTPSESDRFALKAYVFGNKGHRSETGANGITLTESNQHQPTDAGLFGITPMVLRLPENDLSAEQRRNYYLRRLEEHKGVVYVAYYAKKLDMTGTSPSLEIRNKDTADSVPFSYELTNLRPAPQTIPSNMAMVSSGQLISSTANVQIEFPEFDIDEALNVSRIMYGRDSYAIISEIGIVHGVERRISIDSNGASVPFEELICAQISSYVASHIALKFLNKNHSITLDVGATEPILQLAPISE